jgi:hypothetical protein
MIPAYEIFIYLIYFYHHKGNIFRVVINVTGKNIFNYFKILLNLTALGKPGNPCVR